MSCQWINLLKCLNLFGFNAMQVLPEDDKRIGRETKVGRVDTRFLRTKNGCDSS